MNKKGFVLIETLVVTIFVMFIFSILYNSVVPLLGRYEELSYYDDVDVTYDLYHLRKFIINDTNFEAIKSNSKGYKKITCNDLENKSYCESMFLNLGISDDDLLVYLDIGHINELKNDNSYSYDLREYLKYIDTSSDILLLENDDKLSYIEVKSTIISERVLDSAMNSSCIPYVKVDNIIYLSGNDDCVNFNYVWYSGKMWRVTALYPDGTLKMITDDIMTIIDWGEKGTVSSTDLTSAYEASFIREWLNQEFLPTLHDYENIIVEDTKWYSITDKTSPPVKPTGTETLTEAVGLLNAYEYYMSYQNTSYSSSYLNIGYYWWLITPYHNTYVRNVGIYGNMSQSSTNDSYGVRPSIVLKNDIYFDGGRGTIDDPFRIESNKQIVANSTLLNTRQSGEYIKLENDETNQLFRIVDTEVVNNKLTTKLVSNSYLKDINDIDADGNTSEVLTKYFSGSYDYTNDYILWSDVSKTDETYWRGYLNNAWLKQIDNTYNEIDKTSNILEKGIYYLGNYPYGNYKNTVCNNVTYGVSIDNCIATGNVVSNIVIDDYVGILRVGEMFASLNESSFSSSTVMWFITPSYIPNLWTIRTFGILDEETPLNDFAARPTINLKSEIVIKSGSGTKKDPFVVGLAS